MDARTDIEDIRLNASEVNPNRFAAMSLIGVLIALFFACILDELGVFNVDGFTMWGCFLVSLGFCGVALVLVYNRSTVANPATKYFLQFVIFLMTLLILVYLNISAFLLLFLPLLISTRYRSVRVTVIALVSSCICCIAYPLISWAINAWSLNIMTGYLETVCHVTVDPINAPAYDFASSIFNLLVYLSLPQLIVLLLFGSVFIGIARKNVQGLEDHLEVMGLTRRLEQEIERINAMQDDILTSTADLIESRDGETGGHVKRIRKVASLISDRMLEDPSCEKDAHYFEIVGKAAPLHDIGKLTINDNILRKPGPLTPEERNIMRTHPVKGAEIIKKTMSGLESEDFLVIATNIALHHHERYDGTGYPGQLAGKEIPLEARIIAIVDAYDAMVSERSYRKPMTSSEARTIIIDHMGSHFDPDLLKYFMEALPAIETFYGTEAEELEVR